MKSSRLVTLVILAALIILSGYTVASATPLPATIAMPLMKLTAPTSPTGLAVTGTSIPLITITSITLPRPTITVIPITPTTISLPPITIPTTTPKQVHKVVIQVDPLYAGEVKPLGRGEHVVEEGKLVLRAIPNAGYRFDHWTVDGYRKISTRVLRISVDRDHVIVAHFVKDNPKKSVSSVPTKSPSPRPLQAAGCYLPQDIPESLSYTGMYADLVYNRDLLSGFGKGGGTAGQVVIGREAVEPQPWQRYGVKMVSLNLELNGTKFTAHFGSEDYAVIYLKCENGHLSIRLAGLTRYGTRAALLYLLNHPEEVSGKVLVVLGWKDTNSDGKVEVWEVFTLMTVP